MGCSCVASDYSKMILYFECNDYKIDGKCKGNPQTIFNADPGYGMGDYQISPTFALTVPKTVTVLNFRERGHHIR